VAGKIHRPSNYWDQKVACLADKLEWPIEKEEGVNIQEALMIGDINCSFIWRRQIFFPNNFHLVKW
jgi:hypothetical protein